MRKLFFSTIFLIASAGACLAAEFGDLAGTYTGKTGDGGEIVFVVPKSGTPTYRFRGAPMMISSVKVSGKTITLYVGSSGMARVVLSAIGKGFSYKYSDGSGNIAGTLTKQ